MCDVIVMYFRSNAILKARCQILTDWKDDITKAIESTHKKLNNLGNAKVDNANEAVATFVPEEKKEENTCKTVSLDFQTLMRDLDTLYSKYSYINNMNKVPIYNVQKDILNNTPFPWWKPINNYPQMVNYPTQTRPADMQNKKNILSILQDFVSDQKSQKSIMQEWKKMEEKKKAVKKETKTTRRGRDSIQKMKERREIRKCKQFLLREIVKKGETHYLVVRKDVKEPQTLEMEDIFADWNKNLSETRRQHKPRVRKISHRAERKEMLKEVRMENEKVQGPKTYSDILKKNLKIRNDGPEVEEMFGPWIKNVEKMYKPLKPTNAADEVEVFKNWNFIFEDKTVPVTKTAPSLESLDCGKPTMPTIQNKGRESSKKVPTKPAKKQTIEKLSAKLLAEGYPLGKATKVEKAVETVKKIEVCHPVAVRAKTEVVPYVEKCPFKLETVQKIAPVAKDFKPSRHSQRNVVVNDVPVQSFIGPINKPTIPTPPPMPNFNWAELLASATKEASGRGELVKNYKTEEIFSEWRHIFIEANRPSVVKKTKKSVIREYKQDTYFMDWLRNLDEPVIKVQEKKVRKDSCGDKENKTPSPKINKRAERRQAREEFIEEDVTEMKDNRRNDFVKAKKIKDKKRTEASRNSLGKRVK